MNYTTKSMHDYLSHEIQQAEALAEAWENIERYKTKDGHDFKNISLNFSKGAIRPKRYNRDEKAIYVCIKKIINTFTMILTSTLLFIATARKLKNTKQRGA